MPVTELAWVPSGTPGSIEPALIEASRKGIEAQNGWVARHASSTLPLGPPAVRGAAMYQQREDRSIGLLTAHWDSPAQHEDCIAGAENIQAMKEIAAHSVAADITFCHVEGVKMFPMETLEAGLLSILRITVVEEEEKREQVENIWNGSAKDLLRASAGLEHTAGWRIEKEQGKEDKSEFVVVGAWRDEDALSRFAQRNPAWDEVWKDVALEIDVKTYVTLDVPCHDPCKIV
ncbi:hypothetical protein F4782DRAFT_148777 [Xylaria castorea]|nr:hypothetical protein F4782DRAFT_148777 [Xylaria castorea]